MEIKSRLIPILRLSFAKYNPTQKVRDNKLYKKIKGEIGNSGTVPVSSIKIYFNYGNTKPKDLSEIIKNQQYWREFGLSDDLGTIIPNSWKPFVIQEFQFDETAENRLWVVMWFEYKFLEKFSENCIFVFNVNGESVDEDQIIYYSNSDIEEQKKSPKTDGF